jgi:hypothetical protein
LFDLYGHLNIELLKCVNINQELPIIITNDDLDKKYQTPSFSRNLAINSSIIFINH